MASRNVRLSRRLCCVAVHGLVLVSLLLGMSACRTEPTFIRLPMQDGTKLATDLYLPSDGAAAPVILVRSTYGRKGEIEKEWLKEGYAVVIQDVRGMGESEGEPFVFHAEGWQPGLTDGADTVAWVKAQPWCNGRIGTIGGSALGITQLLLAPATCDVHAQFIEVAAGSLYSYITYINGVFLKSMMEGWLTMVKQPHLIDVYKAHPYYDAFWQGFDANARAADVTAPAVLVGGWFDIFQQGTIDSFLAREQQGGEGARGRNILVMKWSSHGPDLEDDYKYKANRFDLHTGDLRRAFFDYHLKGDEHALDNRAKVYYYVMGDDRDPNAPGNEWRTAETWPPFETAPVEFHLRADGLLDRSGPDAADAQAGFTADPANPFPTHGGPNLLLPSGPFDQRKARAGRTDLIMYATAPLDAPLEVTGRISLRLFVSSDAPDTDFTAKLIDIFPDGDGREINVTEGIARVKNRNGLEAPAPLLTGPDEVVEIAVDLWSASWIFNTGHRIGLHIAGSNYPRFEVNPNTGADFPASDRPMRPAHNVVHNGPNYHSALILPLRPE